MTNLKPTSTTREASPSTVAAPARKTASRASSPAPSPTAKSKVQAPVQPAAPASVQLTAAPLKSKHKLVRDSFTIPKSEYLVLDALKLRAAGLMRPTKKSEVLRAGIVALNAMDDKAFLSAIKSVPSLKTGRPKAAPAKPAAK